ncbi:uncharacterized protein LOC141679996 [Apium graveolens]|uniref:uncharacterized protein LOC141679996 n=1 Tax=Apium graveolens TaxID=4045 RepID=UPI003D7AE7BF
MAKNDDSETTSRSIQEKGWNVWYVDNGCSCNMTDDSSILTKFEEKSGPSIITRGDDNKGDTGLILVRNVIIDGVALVEGLKHNLLSVIQLCENGSKVIFDNEACIVIKKSDNKDLLSGKRNINMYVAEFTSTDVESMVCLLSKKNKDKNGYNTRSYLT